jgi:hypothetical protein
MLLPKDSKELLDRALELKEQCFASQQQRVQAYQIWKNYLLTGSADPGAPSLWNKLGAHADRLHSSLFSPAECRFMIEFGQRADRAWHKRQLALSRHLSKEFHASDVDLAFGEAVFWSLPYGAAFTKLGVKTALQTTPEADTTEQRSWWRRGKRRPTNGKGLVVDEQRQVFDSFDPYVVMPHSMGVLNEAVNGLDRQECIAQRIPITRFELARRLRYHPDGLEIMERVSQSMNTRTSDETDGYAQQVIIGGVAPIALNATSTGTSSTNPFMYGPAATLSPKVLANIVWLNELWIIDDERGDYTTIQYVEPDVLIEGGLIRRNIFVPGHHPYTLVQPNEMNGYFWGRSEFADLFNLQNQISDRLADIMRIESLQAAPPHAAMGFTGDVSAMKTALRSRNGLMVSDMPSGKFESLAPEMPKDAYQNLQQLEKMFDELAGFPPIMMGQGEEGVRAGTHAQSLGRNASARIRDRALNVERQAGSQGTLCFDVMAAKDPTAYGLEENAEDAFILADVPADHGVTVDSHSSSPAFTEDSKNLAFQLNRAGAVTPKGLLLMTNPPMVDQLLTMLDEKEQKEAQLIAQHPELLTKGKRKK